MHIPASPASSSRSRCPSLRSSRCRSSRDDAILHEIMGESCWNASRKSGHAIAKHVGVDDKTVAGGAQRSVRLEEFTSRPSARAQVTAHGGLPRTRRESP